MDLHPEEAVLSAAEDEEQEHSDQDLQIRRTVTQVGRFSQLLQAFTWLVAQVLWWRICLQVVHAESQENGQKEAKRGKYEEDEEPQADEVSKEQEEKMDTSSPGATEPKFPSDASQETSTGNGSQGKLWTNSLWSEYSSVCFEFLFIIVSCAQWPPATLWSVAPSASRGRESPSPLTIPSAQPASPRRRAAKSPVSSTSVTW